MSTAIAVNNGYQILQALSDVESMERFGLLVAYIEPLYAPVEPIYCFDIARFVNDSIHASPSDVNMTVSHGRMLVSAREIVQMKGGFQFLFTAHTSILKYPKYDFLRHQQRVFDQVR
jgi:hypothetical protein